MSLLANRAEARGGLFFIGYGDFSGNGGAMHGLSRCRGIGVLVEQRQLFLRFRGAVGVIDAVAGIDDLCRQDTRQLPLQIHRKAR